METSLPQAPQGLRYVNSQHIQPSQYSSPQHPYQNYSHYKQHLPTSSLQYFTLRIPTRALAPRSEENKMHQFIIRNLGAPEKATPFTCPSRRFGLQKRVKTEDTITETVCAATFDKNEEGRMNAGKNSTYEAKLRLGRNDWQNNLEKGDKEAGEQPFTFAKPAPVFRVPNLPCIIQTASRRIGDSYSLPVPIYPVSPEERRWSSSSTGSFGTFSRKGSGSSIFSTQKWSDPNTFSSTRKDSNTSVRTSWTEVDPEEDEMGMHVSIGTKLNRKSFLGGRGRKHVARSGKGNGDGDGDSETVAKEAACMVSTKPMPEDMSVEQFVEELLIEYPDVGA